MPAGSPSAGLYELMGWVFTRRPFVRLHRLPFLGAQDGSRTGLQLCAEASWGFGPVGGLAGKPRNTADGPASFGMPEGVLVYLFVLDCSHTCI